MCGIVGFINHNQNFDESKLRITRMINSIEHRGPDATAVLIGKNFVSATARLSIETIKNGHQPIITNNKRYIASFNGEIFNYKNIIKKYSFSTQEVNSEVKLLVKLFELKGCKFIREIEGQYAISIYDNMQNKLYLFRDRFGIRPLFYKEKENVFVYGSEIKSIAAYNPEILKTSLNSIAFTGLFWSNINDSTSFEDVKQLQPGSYLIYTKNKIEIKRYWNNPLSIKNNNSDGDRNFIDILKSSLKRQIHGEVGFSSYLSGGVDSSAIAYLLTEIQGSPIDTFSIEFENKEYDESDAQKKIQKIIKSNHSSLKISNIDIVDNFEKVINHSEAHLFRTAPIPMFLLAQHVKKSGHKVVFTGEGADEILLGYDIFGETKIRKFWSKFPESKKRPNLLRKLYYYLPQFNNDRYFEITKDFYKKSLQDQEDFFYSHRVRWNQYSVVKNFFNLDKDIFEKKYMTNSFLNSLPNNFKDLGLMEKTQLIEIDTLLSGYLLSSQGDRMTMAHGVEGRYPYLDDIFTNELAEISAQKKSPGLKLKNILRKSLKEYLPKEIVDRPKFAYQAPEAKVFFDNKKGLGIVEEFTDGLSKNEKLNKDSFMSLISKLKDKNSSSRMGFRENMVFIIGLSDHFLRKCASNWAIKKNSQNKKIKYEYYN
jgi:asparagine synthase (glutamine-hydrolysing)